MHNSLHFLIILNTHLSLSIYATQRKQDTQCRTEESQNPKYHHYMEPKQDQGPLATWCNLENNDLIIIFDVSDPASFFQSFYLKNAIIEKVLHIFLAFS